MDFAGSALQYAGAHVIGKPHVLRLSLSAKLGRVKALLSNQMCPELALGFIGWEVGMS